MSEVPGGQGEILSCRPEVAEKVDAVFSASPNAEAAILGVLELSGDQVPDAYFRLAQRAFERQAKSEDGSQPASELRADMMVQRALYERHRRRVGAVAAKDEVGALKRQIQAQFEFKLRWS